MLMVLQPKIWNVYHLQFTEGQLGGVSLFLFDQIGQLLGTHNTAVSSPAKHQPKTRPELDIMENTCLAMQVSLLVHSPLNLSVKLQPPATAEHVHLHLFCE